MEYEVEYPEVGKDIWVILQTDQFQNFATTNLDLYYDTPTQWARVYGDTANLPSCRDRESVLQVTKF